MLNLDFGQDLPSSGSTYLKVKKAGEQIQFRIAQQPSYVGKHFLEKENGWDVVSCPRINSQESCDLCDLFFNAKAEAKKLKEAKSDPAEISDQEKLARTYSCSITFYFPVLNRDTESFGILQTTQGVRNKINAQYEAGVKVMDRDWILRNTGSKNPGEIYSITPVDSGDTKPFTDKEVEEFAKAQEFDKSTINDGASSTDETIEE